MTDTGRSKLISQHNARQFEICCRRNPRFVPQQITHSARDRAERPLSDFKAMGLDTAKLSQMESESVRRSEDWVNRARQHRAGLAAPNASWYRSAQNRFLSGSRGSQYLVPVQSQLFGVKWAGDPPPPPLPPGPLFEGYDSVSQFDVSATGHNYGWLPDLGDEEDHSNWAAFSFDFQAPATANYRLTALMWATGNYIVTADDQWWNSKYASAKLSVTVGAIGPAEIPMYSWDMEPGTKFQTVFEAADDNINAASSINEVSVPVYETQNDVGPIPQGQFLTVTFGWFAECSAKGDGSYADLNFSGAGQGLGCPVCRIDQLP